MPALSISAWGLSDDARARLTAAAGVPVADDGARKGGVLVFAGADRESFPGLLARGADRMIEWTGPAETVAAIRACREPPGLTLSLTTRATYRILTGRMVGDLLVARGLLAGARAGAVAGAVQEALANAVIHGNLGIQDVPSGDPADFAARHQAVARRIAEPEGLARRVTLTVSWTDATLTVAVRDDGAGYAPPAAETPPGAPATSGRGLTIMRQLALDARSEDGGRVTVLTFARSAP